MKKFGNDDEIKNINRKLIYKFFLNGEELPLSEIMDNPTITYDCGLEQYGIGNVYIGELQLTVKNTVFVNYNSYFSITVKVEGSPYPEYLGWFYVYSVEEQGLTKQIKAYDEMFKLNVGYFPSAKHTSTKAIMDDIRQQYSLYFGGTDNYSWGYGDIPINNEQLEGKTVLETLSLVAGVHGGSFFFSHLYLTLAQPNIAKPSVTFTESEYTTPTLDETTTYNIGKLRVIYGEKITDDDGNVTDEGYYEVGYGSDKNTLAISNPFLKGKQTQAQTILNQIRLLNGYKRFDTKLPLGDYRLEPMDVVAYVKGDTTYKVPIIYLKMVISHNGILVETKSPTLAETKKEFTFKGTITQKIDNVYTDMMQVKEIVANVITVSELDAINATIENLKATDATITNLVANKADINDLNATNANITNLQAKDAEIENLVANKADIEDLNATNANIENLNANVATINTLLAGNITSENIQSGSITSDRLVIDDGFIKDAMIDTISASKILSGRIDTGAITIGSEDGKMIIADETIQISDGTNVRVQIGETASGDYALVIWDENGEVMFDATGITENAIKNAIIKDNMISDNANINAQKIDINSLFTAINEDGSHTLNSSKIFLDTQQQTLNVAFNNMTTKQNALEEQTNVLSTELNVQSGKIETLIQNTTVTEEGQTITLKDKVSSIEQDLDGITLQVGTVESNITNITDDVANLEQRVASAELKVTEESIVSTVTNSQVFKDTIIDNMDVKVGGKNLLKQSRLLTELRQYTGENVGSWTVVDDTRGNKDFKQLKSLGDGVDNLLYIPLYSQVNSLRTDTTISFEYEGDNLQFVLTIFNKTSGITSVDNYIDVNDAKVKKIFSYRNDAYERFNTRVSYTFKPTFYSNINFNNYEYGLVFYTTSSNVIVRKPKVEIGNVASDYTEAPEDTNTDVSDLVTRVTTAETKIEQNAEAIALRATKKEVETINGQVTENTEKIGELKVSTDGISAIVSENVNKIDTHTEKISQLEMDVDGINLSVKSIGVGGRNLLRNSAFLKGAESWTLHEGSSIVTPENMGNYCLNNHPFLRVSLSGNEEDVKRGATQRLLLKNGNTHESLYEEKISFSCWYYTSSYSDEFAIELVGYDGGIEYVVASINMNSSNIRKDVWTRVETSVVLDKHYQYLYIYPYVKRNGTVYFTDFMAVRGSQTQTDWSPAPEDTEADISECNTKISELKMTSEQIKLSVSETNQVITETSIGVRNLLRNSAFIKGTDSWEGFYETIPTSIDKTKVYNGHPSVKFGHKENHQQTDGYTVKQTLTLGEDVGGVAKVGEQFTLSGWYYCEDASTFVGSDYVPNHISLTVVGSPVGDNTAFYSFKNSDATVCVNEGESYGNSTSPIVIGKWTKIETTFKINSISFGDYVTTEYDKLQGWISVHGGGVVWFTDIMLTRGNKAPNEWIAAPEDTSEAIDAIEQQVVTNTQSIASLMINADSINASVQRVEQSVTSSLDGMNQNITSLTNRVDATMSAEDVKIEIQKEMANGSNKVTTSTGFTFNENGLTVDKSDSEMSTNINENGMIITKNNETVLTANNKGVQAKNLYATTYLIVGNSRFESYKGNRTGCFYVFEPSIEMTDEANVLNEEGEE